MATRALRFRSLCYTWFRRQTGCLALGDRVFESLVLRTFPASSNEENAPENRSGEEENRRNKG